MNLISRTASSIESPSPHEGLANMPEESVWLANFTSPQTRATYKNAVTDLVSYLGLQTAAELYAIDRAHVIAWRDGLINNGASPRTVASRLSAVSSLFAYLCERQLAPKNPVAGVKRPKVASQTVETPALTVAQVRSILDAPDLNTLQGLRDSALLHVYFYTGCRVSEPCRLRVRDLHEDQGYKVLDFTVKGGKRLRVALHPECVNALQTYIAAMAAEYGEAYNRDAWLFQRLQQRSDKPLARLALYNMFKKYARLADLPESVAPHSARATFVTEALDRGHPVEAVQQTVGHSSPTTTLAYDKRGRHPKNSASFAVRY